MKRISRKYDESGALKAIGSAIRSTRREAGHSQEELAHLSGLDRSHMGRIERGERNLTILNFNRIALALKVRPSELMSKAEP